MKPEDIKKCAAALGVTEEEFAKSFIGADTLEKAKKGLAALHGNLKKAHEHAEAHVEHLGKCMKACGDVMGTGSEKALTDMLETLTTDLNKAAKKEEPAVPETITKTDAQKLVDDAVAKAVKEALDKLPANDAAAKAKLFSVERGKAAELAKAQDNPYPGIV